MSASGVPPSCPVFFEIPKVRVAGVVGGFLGPNLVVGFGVLDPGSVLVGFDGLGHGEILGDLDHAEAQTRQLLLGAGAVFAVDHFQGTGRRLVLELYDDSIRSELRPDRVAGEDLVGVGCEPSE